MSDKLVHLDSYRAQRSSGARRASEFLSHTKSDSLELREMNSEIWLIESFTKKCALRCVSPNDRNPIIISSSPISQKMKASYAYFESLYARYRYDFVAYKSFKEHLRYTRSWINIWDIYWDLSYISLERYQQGREGLKKFVLHIPSIEDIEHCANILPWSDLSQKMLNLFWLLWIYDWNEMSFWIWTWDRVVHSLWNSRNRWLHGVATKIIHWIESLFNPKSEKMMKIVRLENGRINFVSEPTTSVHYLCWIK